MGTDVDEGGDGIEEGVMPSASEAVAILLRPLLSLFRVDPRYPWFYLLRSELGSGAETLLPCGRRHALRDFNHG